MLLLPATLTMHEARDALRMLAQAIQREPSDTVVVHAGSLQQFDSSAIAVLLECERQQAQRVARLARRDRGRQQQHGAQLFAGGLPAAAALLRSASLPIRPSMPFAPISWAKLLR